MKNGFRRRELLIVLVLAIAVLIMNVNPLMVNAAVYKVSSDVEQYKVNYLVKNYSTRESQHFIYRFTSNDRDTVSMVMEEAEKSYDELSKVFGYTLKNKITIIIFPSIDSMNMAIGLSPDTRAMGLYNSGFISILSPKEWVSANSIAEYKQIFDKAGPVLHELTHYFVDMKANGNYPEWFTEGVALYFEKSINGTEWGKGENYEMAPYTLEELANNFGNLNQDYAYRCSLEIVSNYVDKYGVDKLIESIGKLGQGHPLEGFGN